jgi:NADPH:quinone reductase
MKAWIKADGVLRLSDVPPPTPGSDEFLLRVEAVSLNRGEVRAVARAADGLIPGWDVAGTVAEPAATGRGPAAGTRVAALVGSGGWAEYARVPVAHAAAIPNGVDVDMAATLPVAGLTVMRAFDVAGSLLGKSVLLTGGSGGVGQLAIQLGALSGARVTAVSSQAGRREALRELGAEDVVASITDATGSYDLILESVGGHSLAAAIERVARGGVVVTIGNSSEQETTFNARTLYAKGGATVYGLLIFEEVESRRVGGIELERLLGLVATGQLRPSIQVRRPWTELEAVLEDLEHRVFAGKAVLSVA